MPTKNSPLFYGAAALAIGLVLTATPVYAGFEWVSPAAEPAPSSAPASLGAPAPVIIGAPVAAAPANTMPEIISPVIISGDSKAATASPASAAPSYPDTTSYLTPPPAPAEPAQTLPLTTSRDMPPAAPAKNTLATATIAAPAPASDVVQGFASQVPVGLALRQILPMGIHFTIDPDVALDTVVSYKGGSPWRQTLDDMLTPAGLVAHDQGNEIIVSHMATAAALPPAPTPAPASAPTPMASSAPLPLTVTGNTPPSGADKAPKTMTMTMPASAMTASNPPDIAPPVSVNSPDGWTAQRGDTLRQVLTDWCRRSNTELQWEAEYDYPVEASAHFMGSFEDAVRTLLAGFDGARPQPIGELHDSPTAAQMVLVVQARGNSYSN